MYLLNNRRMLAGLAGFAFVSLAPFLIGCNSAPKRVDVKGNVKYQNLPVKSDGVQVSFIGSDNVPLTVDVDSNGDYVATGVLPGENKILVSWVIPVQDAKRGKSTGVREPPPPAPKSPIPAKYAKPDESDLKYTVDPDKENVYNIDLK